MAEIIMPKMGDAMTEGKVVRWYKKAGDAVKKGEPVLEIETDKVNLDLEAEQDGGVGEIAADEGQMVPVGGRLATILGAGEKAPAPSEPQRRATDKKDSVKHTTGEYAEAIETKGPRKDKSAPPETTAAARPPHSTEGRPRPPTRGPRKDRRAPPETTAAARPPHSTEGRQRSSPLARRMARELGVDLKGVQGSGPQGRIIAKDVLSGGQALMPAGDGERPWR